MRADIGSESRHRLRSEIFRRWRNVKFTLRVSEIFASRK
jgi:hypothetical protein